MNTRTKLFALLAAVGVLAVAAIAVPRGDTDGGNTDESLPIASTAPAGATAESRPKEPKKPKPPLLTAENPKELKVEYGEMVVFSAKSSTADEIHVHGYDKSLDLPADQRKTMRFKADIEGIFEIELEQSGQPIGTLTVSAQ